MQSLITLISILTPLIIGFFIRIPKKWQRAIDRLLALDVYLILLLIGVSLAQVGDLANRLSGIVGSVVLLFVCTIGMNLIALAVFDKLHPWPRQNATGEQANIGIGGSLRQIICVIIGFILGQILPENLLPPEKTGTYALMLLVFLVAVQLRGSGITLRQILINKRGVQTAIWFSISSLIGGIVFAALQQEVTINQALALASGFGWYSLSGIMITETYGPVWGTVALLNDLSREFFALFTIPFIMRRFPCTAIGIGGATSLDFTLPVIRASGGLEAVPVAISFGFITNILPPILMITFPAFQ